MQHDLVAETSLAAGGNIFASSCVNITLMKNVNFDNENVLVGRS